MALQLRGHARAPALWSSAAAAWGCSLPGVFRTAAACISIARDCCGAPQRLMQQNSSVTNSSMCHARAVPTARLLNVPDPPRPSAHVASKACMASARSEAFDDIDRLSLSQRVSVAQQPTHSYTVVRRRQHQPPPMANTTQMRMFCLLSRFQP